MVFLYENFVPQFHVCKNAAPNRGMKLISLCIQGICSTKQFYHSSTNVYHPNIHKFMFAHAGNIFRVDLSPVWCGFGLIVTLSNVNDTMMSRYLVLR